MRKAEKKVETKQSTLSLPNEAKGKFRASLQISFCKVLKNNHFVKVQAESFHFNGHIVGFHPQTQKLESPYKTPSSTLAVKGLKSKHSLINSPNQFSSDLYFVSFYVLALSTGFIFVNTGLQLEGR